MTAAPLPYIVLKILNENNETEKHKKVYFSNKKSKLKPRL
jgi:hypothetical protein